MSLVRRRGAVAGARAAGGPVTADITATLPALEQSATGTALVAGAVSGDIAATLPALTQSAAGSVEVRGDIAATLPALTQAATGTVEALSAEIFDDFNRANEPLEDSSDWVVTRQDADIVSNELVVSRGRAFHQTALSSDNHYVEYTCVSWSAAALGAILRHDSAASVSNGYHARCDFGGDFWQIFRIDSGSFTEIADVVTPTPTVDGDLVRFEISGSTIRILLNGAEMLSTTDSTHTVGKYVGLSEGRTVSATIDDFTASPL